MRPKKKKLLLVVNPKAGIAQGALFLRQLSAIFSRDYSVMIHITDCAGDAREICSAYGGQYDMIVCVGGDGTLNEVINGVMKHERRPSIGYLPAGTTNDFASSLGLSRIITQAAKNVMSGRMHTFDVGCFGGKYFSYIASFGAFTEASYNSPQELKNVFGSLVYVLEGIRDIANLRSHHVRVETGDGRVIEGDYIFGAFSNSTSIAGMIRLADSDVDFNDGLFELMLINMPKNLNDLNKTINSLITKKYNEDVITFSHASRARVILEDETTAWTVDGEYMVTGKEVEVRNVKDALTLIY